MTKNIFLGGVGSTNPKIFFYQFFVISAIFEFFIFDQIFVTNGYGLSKESYIFFLVGSIVAGMTSFSFLEDLDVAKKNC